MSAGLTLPIECPTCHVPAGRPCVPLTRIPPPQIRHATDYLYHPHPSRVEAQRRRTPRHEPVRYGP